MLPFCKGSKKFALQEWSAWRFYIKRFKTRRTSRFNSLTYLHSTYVDYEALIQKVLILRFLLTQRIESGYLPSFELFYRIVRLTTQLLRKLILYYIVIYSNIAMSNYSYIMMFSLHILTFCIRWLWGLNWKGSDTPIFTNLAS